MKLSTHANVLSQTAIVVRCKNLHSSLVDFQAMPCHGKNSVSCEPHEHRTVQNPVENTCMHGTSAFMHACMWVRESSSFCDLQMHLMCGQETNASHQDPSKLNTCLYTWCISDSKSNSQIHHVSDSDCRYVRLKSNIFCIEEKYKLKHNIKINSRLATHHRSQLRQKSKLICTENYKSDTSKRLYKANFYGLFFCASFHHFSPHLWYCTPT